MWYHAIFQPFRVKELRNKIFLALGVLAVLRLMANIPIIGVDTNQLKQFFGEFGIFQLLGAFTGGSLGRFSVALFGVGAFLTAVIIFPLMAIIFSAPEKPFNKKG